ncbi:MAG: hypothetical protein HY748_08620 [Elusimicrobia bacterium]|nr:hypothetical protein [Elusimicrobiota bacterium]
MRIIVHRVNTSARLRRVPARYGVEIDLRSRGRRIVLQHEAMEDGEDFSRWLKGFRHGTLILNVKEDGIEDRVRRMVLARGIEDFFFLDLSFPALVRMTRRGERRVAVRVSEYEPLDTALRLRRKAAWVWLDCFTRLAWDRAAAEALATGFKVCVASPEVQGHPVSRIPSFKRALAGFEPAAVCTKVPERWL